MLERLIAPTRMIWLLRNEGEAFGENERMRPILLERQHTSPSPLA